MALDWMLVDALPGESMLETITKQPAVMLFLMFNYIYFVKRCGPKWMKNREAFDLRSVIIAYNTAQIFINMFVSYFCYRMIIEQTGNILSCIDTGDITKRAHYVLIYSKYTDLIETVMFVLRKKQSQVSFLHVYHHVAVISIPTFALNINPGGMAMLYGVVNAIVHVIMYTYYLMTNLFPEKRAILDRIKPRITEVQLIQFFVLTVHFLRPVFGFCDTSLLIAFLGVSQNAVFCYLFTSFYSKAYLMKKKNVKKAI